MSISNALAETLARLSHAAEGAVDEWWLIGSAAIVLHGGQVAHVKDVDLMMTARDADAFLRRVGARFGGAAPSELFRSEVFGAWEAPPVPVEVFGGFRFATQRTWREVCFSSREPVRVGEATVFVPSRAELIQVLHSFGRPKDLERAKLLQV